MEINDSKGGFFSTTIIVEAQVRVIYDNKLNWMTILKT
jgi:hypothetical protein